MSSAQLLKGSSLSAASNIGEIHVSPACIFYAQMSGLMLEGSLSICFKISFIKASGWLSR